MADVDKRHRSLALGVAVTDAILKLHADDGFSKQVPHVFGVSTPGVYRPTLPAGISVGGTQLRRGWQAPVLAMRGRSPAADLNPGMLSMARTVSEIAQPPIDWRERNLEALPFADAEFDAVLCLQGLQFTTKRNVAAAELHRILQRRGRLVLSVWRDPEHCPYAVAITDALKVRLGVEAGRRMAAPCSLGSAAELRAPLRNVGFQDVYIRIDVLPMRVPDPDEFLPEQFVASPLAADIAALGESARTELFDDIVHRLLPHIDDGGLAAPFEAPSIAARR